MNSLISLAIPFCRPWPATRTLLAFPSSLSPTMILKGLPLMCCPFLKTFTKCSPTSRGVKEIPTTKQIHISPVRYIHNSAVISLPQKILICRSLHNSVAVQQIIISNIPFSLFWVQGKVGFFSKQEKLCISKSREDLIHISAEISHHEHLVFHFFSYFHDVMVPVWSRNIHVIVS